MFAQLAMVAMTRSGAAGLLQVMVEKWGRLDQMPVPIDDRMIEPIADGSHFTDSFPAHA